MGKKKRGGKKTKAGGRGGLGGKKSQGAAPKKQYCGRRELYGDVPSERESIPNEAAAAVAMGGELGESGAQRLGPQIDVDGSDSSDTKAVGAQIDADDADNKVISGVRDVDRVDGAEEGGGTIHDREKAACEQKIPNRGPISDDNDGDSDRSGFANGASSDDQPVKVQNGHGDLDTPTGELNDSQIAPIMDANHDSSGQDSDSSQPCHDDTVSSGADTKEHATGIEGVVSVCIDEDIPLRDGKGGSNAMPKTKDMLPKTVNASEILQALESFTPDDSASLQQKKDIGPYSSQYSSEMEEVDLNSSGPPESAPAPIVRAFASNGIAPGTNSESSLDFHYSDSTERDAFSYLTASLREALGEDAKHVTDEMLSRYIHWKPDVKRAADRFRSYQKFRKENPYIFDDKPLLISQDPKLAFLIQNGMVVAPDELRAKDGSGVVVIRGAKCDVSAHDCDGRDASRAIFFILQNIFQRSDFDPLKGMTIVLDLTGILRRNVPKRLASLLSKAAGCFPFRIRAIYVIAAPWWFPSSNAKLFSTKVRSRIHFLKNKTSLTEHIDKDRLLEEDGGIYTFDLQRWISSIVLSEVEQT